MTVASIPRYLIRVSHETYNFVLIVEGEDLQQDAIADALFEAGCDDGLVGLVDGVHYIEFDREAVSLIHAVLAAIESVGELNVVRLADAELISTAAIDARTGRTRESVRLLISGLRGPGDFLPPVTDPGGKWINAGLELRRHGSSVEPESLEDLRALTGI